MRTVVNQGGVVVLVAMEDTKKEIVDIVRALVTKPTLQHQADTLRKYFSPDVKFYHYYIDTIGIEDLIAVYQVRPTSISMQQIHFLNM